MLKENRFIAGGNCDMIAWRNKGYQVKGHLRHLFSVAWGSWEGIKSVCDQTPVFLSRWQGHQRGALNCSLNESDRPVPPETRLVQLELCGQVWLGPSHFCLCLPCSCVNEYGRLWFPVQNCFNWQRWCGEDVPRPKIHSGKGTHKPRVVFVSLAWGVGGICWDGWPVSMPGA